MGILTKSLKFDSKNIAFLEENLTCLPLVQFNNLLNNKKRLFLNLKDLFI